MRASRRLHTPVTWCSPCWAANERPLPQNDTAQQPGRLEGRNLSQRRYAGPVCCSGLFGESGCFSITFCTAVIRFWGVFIKPLFARNTLSI